MLASSDLSSVGPPVAGTFFDIVPSLERKAI
eukprot:SAG11_NODE_36107_length_263_cov_0.823171_1_plen_30_part_01